MVKVLYNKEKKEWDILLKHDRTKGLYIDGFLKNNLDLIKDLYKKDWDMVIIVDGDEGSGKSVLAQQIAYYCDPTLIIDRICFTPETFKKAVLRATAGQSVVYDDSYSGMSSRGAMLFINQMLINLLTLMRQKKLFVFIVIPAFFELNKYAAIWRSIALINVRAPGFQRGYFYFYKKSKKKELYIKGKKTYSYCVRPDFKGRFAKGYVVDEADYRQKKVKELENFDPFEYGSSSQRFMQQRNGLVMALSDKGFTYAEIASMCSKYCDEALTEVAIKKFMSAERKRRKNLQPLPTTFDDSSGVPNNKEQSD